jgi:hypothetical protein
MKAYILFIFGMFEDHEDIEYFCSDILSECKSIDSIKYVMEGEQNLIVIFDSNENYENLSKDLYKFIVNDNIKFYFVFQRDSIVTAHLPHNVKDFIFKPSGDNNVLRLDYSIGPMDLDEVLEKIEKQGLESLTPDEKNFLDNFENS